MIGLEDILAVFEEEQGATVMGKSAACFDRVCAERGWAEASALWSRACHEHDRIYMTEEDYEANYGSCD